MRTKLGRWIALCGCLILSPPGVAEEVLFEDTFDAGLSAHWEAVGLQKNDYRIRDGGLELRVQPGTLTRETGMLKLKVLPNLPKGVSATFIVSVEVTLIDQFSEPEEFAGLYLTDNEGVDFGGRKQLVCGQLAFSPGLVEYIGEEEDEGDPENYTVKYWPADINAGPLRIIVRDDYVFFQVGPSTKGKYLNFFHSAIRSSAEGRSFAIVAAGAPADRPHWVRFDNFRITK